MKKENEKIFMKLMFHTSEVVYIVRLHRLTKHGYKYVSCVEYDSLAKAKKACEYWSKYPGVDYCDFLTLTKNLCPTLKECVE